nr:putative ribonuclease H-like domain-containing protein [Tanacetum cinerariifolium]
ETKASTLLLQSLPEDHMADFHHLDDAREIWLVVKARFGGLHKGDDRFQKILSQLNQMQAKPDNDDVNLKFLRALPPSWSLEIDVKGGSSYGSRGTTVAPTHSAFIGAASTNTKMVYSDQPNHFSSVTYTSAHSGSIMEDVLQSFVAENKPTQQLAYEDFDQARYSAFKISEVKKEEPKAMVSVDSMLNWNEHEAENKTEKGEQVYGSMAGFKSDFADHAGNAVGSVYDAAAEFVMMGISPKVQTCPFGFKTLELQKDWYHKTQLALKEKVRILSANLENTTNTLKYFETLYDHAKIEKKEWEVKLVESLARFDKWKESSKNLVKLINSSMSTRTKLGLGFKEYNGSDEVFDLSIPSVFDPEPENREVKSLYESFVKSSEMHEVPPPITRTFLPTSYKSDLEETQVTFGSNSNTSSINTFESNDFVSCDNSDKSLESATYDFASCISSPKTNDSFPTVDVKILPKYDVKDPSPTNGFPSCSFKENVKPPRNLCNKSGIADRIPCKNNFVHTKTCFVCGSKYHVIKDCDVYDNVDHFPSVALKAAYVLAGSRNSLASIFAGRSIPATSKNKPASIHAGRHIPTGRFNKPAPFPAGRSVPTGNKVKLDDFVQVKRGTVTFRGRDGKITRKGTIRTSKLNFANVYYVEELQNFNLFYVSQICDKKNKVLFTNAECLVLTKEFQLLDESQVVLRIPRRHDLYTFNLSDIQPEQHINCLLPKASLEESTKWHRRMAHVNFKTINKLAKNELVEGKQHKASYKAISTVRTISEPLKLLHMDLFGPISIRSIDQKYYSLVVTDDFSRFNWTFFLGTKDETFYILKDFIALIENQLNKKVKAIRYDNETEFRNTKLIGLCEEKGIKRDYSNARTPQQNGVAERKNRTLIDAARSMVSITNPHNKTPYELLSGKVPNISHLKPFRCQVTILNTSDHLGKFEGKANEGFLVGYAANSKAYRVYNLSSKKVKETLNLRYLEAKPNVQGLGQEWYFDHDYSTDSLGYTRFKTNTPAGTQDTNINAGTQDDDSESECDEQAILVPSFPSNSFLGPKLNTVSATIENHLDYAEELARPQRQEHEAHSTAKKNLVLAARDPAGSIVSTSGIPAASILASSVPACSVPDGGVPARSIPASSVPASSVPAGGVLAGSVDSARCGDPAISESVPAVFDPVHADNSILPPGNSLGLSEHSTGFPSPSDLGNHQPTAGIFSSSSYDDDFCTDVTNLASSVAVDLVATKRQEEGIDYDEVFALVARIEAIRLFLAFASYMGFEDPHNPKHVYTVVKALYGLHQAPRACQDKYVKNMLKKFDMKSVRTPTIPYKVPKPKSKDELDDAINVHLYISMIGSLIRLISWRCKKQTIMATSSTEAEYVAAASCCGQASHAAGVFAAGVYIVVLSEATLTRMLKHGLEVPKLLFGGDLTMAEQLSWLVEMQMAFGKDFSNSLMADNLPKIVWTSNHHITLMKSWLVLSKLLQVFLLVLPAGFLIPVETSSVAKALKDPDWVAAMQEEMPQFFNQQVFALVARIEAIRLFLAFASYMGFMVYQMNMKSAFLYGEIEEEVCVTQPKGFEDPHNPKHVYTVVKALRGTIDKTLFLKKDSRHIILVQVYVDDIIFGSTNKAWCDDFEVLMKGEFEMSVMGIPCCWRIRNWRLYPRAQVHVLETMDGRVIYMFVDVSYPLSEATLTRMMKHGLEVPKLLFGGDLTMAEQLVSFIKAALLNAQSAV